MLNQAYSNWCLPLKSALRGLTEALAREVGRYNIKVNLLAPGLLAVDHVDAHDHRLLARPLGVEDVTTPPDKAKILDYYETQASRIESQYRKGIITDDERRQELIENLGLAVLNRRLARVAS